MEKPIAAFATSREIRATREQVFAAISKPERLAPLRGPAGFPIILSASATGTVVSWEQDFANPEAARHLEQVVVPANQQNLERLAAEVPRNPAD